MRNRGGRPTRRRERPSGALSPLLTSGCEVSLARLRFSVLNGCVTKRVLPAALALFACCVSAFAQTGVDTIVREELEQIAATEVHGALSLGRPDLFSGVDSATLIHGLPVLTLLDGRRFPISSELGRMGMTPFDVFPVAFLSAVEVQKPGWSPRYGGDAKGGVVNLLTRRFDYGGEVGFFYGRSDGKYGREDYSGYIIGGVGNEKFNITVGAAYSESEVRVPRGRRSRD